MNGQSSPLGHPFFSAFWFGGNVLGEEAGIYALRLSRRVTVVYGDPWSSVALALVSSKGLVVVDFSWSKSVALELRKAISAEFVRDDFAFLINSHEPDNCSGGNAAYADLSIIGHDSVRRGMLKMQMEPTRRAKWRDYCAADEIAKMRAHYDRKCPSFLDTPDYASCVKCFEAVERDFHTGPVVTPPTLTFDQRLTLHLGDLTIRLVHCGGFHIAGDTIVSVPEENLMIISPLFLPNQIPVVTSSPAETTTPAMVRNWLAMLRETLDGASENTRFMVSSHRQFMNKNHVTQVLDYLENTWNGVRLAKAEGKTLEQARAALSLGRFPSLDRFLNDPFVGTESEVRDIHCHNSEFFWKVLSP